jgi:N-acetylneuraminate lyase
MSVEERKATLEHWIASAKGRFLVIAHVGSEALTDVNALTVHAAQAGAHAIGWMPGTFFKPDGIEGCIKGLSMVAELAPSLPLYYYHIAIKTGVNIRCDLLLNRVAQEQAKGNLRSFRGIKYSDADLHILANCIAGNGGQFDIAYGKDEQMLGAIAMGCKGFVGSTYNYCGRVYNKAIEAAAKGDWAAALVEQRKAQSVVDLLYAAASYGNGAANVGKAIMEARLGGKHCGSPRYPICEVTAEGRAKLHKDLEALGFFGW